MAPKSSPMLNTPQNNNSIANLYNESHRKPKLLNIQPTSILLPYDLFAREQEGDVRKEDRKKMMTRRGVKVNVLCVCVCVFFFF